MKMSSQFSALISSFSDEELWHQISLKGEQPPARHAHTAVVHDGHIWVYGGMTDLTERSDFWRYDSGMYDHSHNN